MFTKILVCSVTLACIALLAGLLDRNQQVHVARDQGPSCSGVEQNCTGVVSTPRGTAEHFFHLLAMR